MCSARPKPPKIVKQGPSKAEMAAQEQQLAAYREQIRMQQEGAAAQLQAQIEAASAETARREQEMAALQQQQVAQQAAAFTISTAPATEVDMAAAQVTTATTPRRKRTDTLRVETGPTATAKQGAGLNIGVM
jgi:hypothetical protein